MTEKTVFEHLHARLNRQIGRQNFEFVYKIDPKTGEKVTPSPEEIKSDVNVLVLRNIQRRKKNILKREGD